MQPVSIYLTHLFHYLADNHIALGAVAFFSWSVLYFIFRFIVFNLKLTQPLSKVSKTYMTESLVSAIQGFVCGGIGAIGVYRCHHDVMNCLYSPIIHYCTYGTGYFIYDLFAMYYSNHLMLKEKGKLKNFYSNFKSYLQNSGLMIAHHIILTAILFPALIAYSNIGHFFAGCFFCMELSSPFVNFRVVLSKLGLKSTKLYLMNGILMTVLFFIFRVIVFPYMYAHYLLQQSAVQKLSFYAVFKKIPLVCHSFCILILSPQLYWFSMMVNGVFSVLAKKPKALDKYD